MPDFPNPYEEPIAAVKAAHMHLGDALDTIDKAVQHRSIEEVKPALTKARSSWSVLSDLYEKLMKMAEGDE